jgi:hypothetical protein
MSSIKVFLKIIFLFCYKLNSFLSCLRRGITAQPVLNGFCGDYEYGMENSVVLSPEFNYFADTEAKYSTLPFNAQNKLKFNNLYSIGILILLLLLSKNIY